MRSPVGDMILDAMRRSKTNQSKVSRATGLSKSYVSQLISGSRSLTPQTAVTLEECLKHFNGKKAIIEQFKYFKKLSSKP